MGKGNVFILSVCVCLSVWAITFECLDIETSILVWWNILAIYKLEYQDHWVKVKATLVKWAFWTVRHLILLL